LRHQRTYLAGKLSNKLLSTHLDLAIALTEKENSGGKDLWQVVQQWKAISLSDLLWDSQSYIPDSSTVDEQAKSLIEEEKSLVDQIRIAEPYERPNLRMKLRMHWLRMASHTGLTTFSTMKLGMGASFDHLKQIQQISDQLAEGNNSVIFIDWTRHRNNIFLFAVLSAQTSQTMHYWCLPLSYANVENWVRRKLREVQDSTGLSSRKRLDSAEDLRELSSLIDPLRQIIKGDELLALCPSGVLNEIPIHAIPFSGTDNPLITTNPIVYSSSHAIMKSCVDAAFQKINSDRASTKFAAFGRFGDLDQSEDDLIKTMVIDLAEQFHGFHATGYDLKRDTFKNYTSDADFIHYHGHASCESDTSIRSLVLEPNPESGDNGRFMVDDIFQLQLQATHVTLLACASGEQEFSFNDDPLGIVTAFHCAGASSVVGTLWPTDCRDARDFCDGFYDQIKNEGNSVINLAKAVQKAVLMLRADWDFDDPYHWAQFVLCKLRLWSCMALFF
jgi:CHAT domain-containing protein